MNFIEIIFDRLHRAPDRPVLREVRDGVFTAATGRELLDLITRARDFARQAGLKKGDRCGLLANNSVRWAALDLALMADGIIVVPLYARQAPDELVKMMQDAGVSLVCCGDQTLVDGVKEYWPDAPPTPVFDEIWDAPSSSPGDQLPIPLSDSDPLTIIYTSGTSGEAKGVILNVGNLSHMIPCTNARLDRLMGVEGEADEPDQVFHYLPFCFAGSWILLLTSLSRHSLLTISTDLNRLAEELKLAAPQYCLNVPALLERIRMSVEGQIRTKPRIIRRIYRKGCEAWRRRADGESISGDLFWLGVAQRLIFSSVRKKIGPNLRALICGSAPLSRETQLFFMMLGIPVLQVYGLTETTAICTMDDPLDYTPGRVGPAIPGVEMKLGEGDEILVRGPNIFPGYWNRPEATAQSMSEGWFHTGDQGRVDERGNWSIIGRIKNLIILNSGHNIAPEPIEEMILQQLQTASQVVLQGNGRGFLTALITGDVTPEEVERVIERVNTEMPHYKNIRGYHLRKEPLTIESGLLTANGKLRREAIAAHFEGEIDKLYRAKKALA